MNFMDGRAAYHWGSWTPNGYVRDTYEERGNNESAMEPMIELMKKGGRSFRSGYGMPPTQADTGSEYLTPADRAFFPIKTRQIEDSTLPMRCHGRILLSGYRNGKKHSSGAWQLRLSPVSKGATLLFSLGQNPVHPDRDICRYDKSA
jgi:hypothetical protein